MIRLWARTLKNHKLVKSIIFESIDNYNRETFYLVIQKICHQLDIPTPVLLEYHIDSFEQFNNCHFFARDFVESINFDRLEIEDASLK